MPSPLFVANWKMNMLRAQTEAFCRHFMEMYTPNKCAIDVGIAPAVTSFDALKNAFGDSCPVLLGVQNVHWLDSGAHTGELSADMVKEMGASFAIIGHSERRQFYGETDRTVSLRAKAAITHGLTAIVCVGELLDQFQAKQTDTVVTAQLEGSLDGIANSDLTRLVIAYEPVWAIGTGLAATPEIAENVHKLIRNWLCEKFGNQAGASVQILYGGSTKPENIAELMACPNINGALVGGASLKPDVFWQLIANGRPLC